MTTQSTPTPISILIVDDNRIIRHLLKLTFADNRFKLFDADSSETALPLIHQHKPDYVILDVMMPGELDGFQICQYIKSQPDTQSCKVILLTARGQQEDFALGKQVGADKYLTKPFSPGELLTYIDSDLSKV